MTPDPVSSNVRDRRPSSTLMIFWAMMCTTVGDTAFATRPKVRSTFRKVSSYCRPRASYRASSLCLASLDAWAIAGVDSAAVEAAGIASAALLVARALPPTWADTAGPPRASTTPSSTPALIEVNDRITAEDRESINGTPGEQSPYRIGACRRDAGVAWPSTSALVCLIYFSRSEQVKATCPFGLSLDPKGRANRLPGDPSKPDPQNTAGVRSP